MGRSIYQIPQSIKRVENWAFKFPSPLKTRKNSPVPWKHLTDRCLPNIRIIGIFCKFISTWTSLNFPLVNKPNLKIFLLLDQYSCYSVIIMIILIITKFSEYFNKVTKPYSGSLSFWNISRASSYKKEITYIYLHSINKLSYNHCYHYPCFIFH